MRVGLGWMLLPIGREKLDMAWHNGGTGGYRSFVGWTPATHAAAVVVSSNVRGVDRLRSRVLLDLAATAEPLPWPPPARLPSAVALCGALGRATTPVGVRNPLVRRDGWA
jgi:hypothetical protein